VTGRPGAPETVASVVITFQRRDLLRVTLNGLLAQERPVDEIVVIDNACTDGTATMLDEEFPTVTHLRMERNIGPAGALHVGFSHAHQRGHRWAWTTSDDYVAKPAALRTLLEAAHRLGDDHLGLLGCWFEPVGRHFTHNGALWRHRPIQQQRPAVGSPPYRADIMVFKGTLISMDLVPEVGLPHEHYFLMNEEYEYCLRASRQGRRHYVLPVPLLRPLEAVPPSGYPPWRSYYQTRNHLDMVLDHRSPGELLWWAIAQAKYCAGAVQRGDRAGEHIRLRALGAWHALRGVTGRTVDPARWAARPSAPSTDES
jgi:rhamnopyranosyl-N-acetylglucosaminyl-diphospho-decaprenol beta-1,3/1,4-galactofuranosyltransferase